MSNAKKDAAEGRKTKDDAATESVEEPSSEEEETPVARPEKRRRRGSGEKAVRKEKDNSAAAEDDEQEDGAEKRKRKRADKLEKLVDSVAEGKKFLEASKIKTRRSRRVSGPTAVVRKMQNTRHCLIPMAAFKRVVHSVICGGERDMRIQEMALLVAQGAVEDHIVRKLRRAKKLAEHAKRITVSPNDIDMAKKRPAESDAV